MEKLGKVGVSPPPKYVNHELHDGSEEKKLPKKNLFVVINVKVRRAKNFSPLLKNRRWI